MASVSRFQPKSLGSDADLISAYLKKQEVTKCPERKTSRFSRAYFYMAARTEKSKLVDPETFKAQRRAEVRVPAEKEAV